MEADLSHLDRPLGFFDRLLLLTAAGIAGALFLSVGWMAVAPDDPQGPVSLVAHSRPVTMAVQVAALAAVTAAIGTVLVGTKLPDVGLFAAALGMALATVRGSTAAYLLMYVAQGERGAERALAGRMALEAVVWFAVVLVCLVGSGLVMRWCFGGVRSPEEAAKPAGPRVTAGDMAISDCPVLGRAAARTGGRSSDWQVTGITALTALVLYPVLAAGSAPRAVHHGQICFAVFAAFYVGVWIARRWRGVRTAFWSLLAVPVVAVVGYLWATMAGGGTAPRPANIPASAFLRALPMTFVAMGALGVLVAQWTTVGRPPSPPSAVKPSRRASPR